MGLGRAIIWLVIIIVLGYGISIVISKTGSLTDSALRGGKDDGRYRPESVTVFISPIDGGVVYSGAVTLPNPCFEMSEPKVTVKNPQLVRLEFAAEPGSEACVQVIEEREFSVEADGAVKEAVIDLVFNGKKVQAITKIVDY